MVDIIASDDEEQPLLSSQSFSTSTKVPRPYEEEPLWRRPFNYSVQHGIDPEKLSRLQRYRYYQRLAPPMTMVVPDHVIPPEFFTIVPMERGEKQSSIVTIFSLWNTMLGTSLLCMPAAMLNAGLILGCLIVFGVGLVTCYTAIITVQVTMDIQLLDTLRNAPLEFVDVIEYYMPFPSAQIALSAGAASFLGALMVFWILLSNFTYGTGIALSNMVNGTFHFHNLSNFGAVCDAYSISSPVNTTGSTWNVWSADTVPIYLVLILFPLCCLKSATVLAKFNSLGVVCIAMALVFVVTKASQWGINITLTNSTSIHYVAPAVVDFNKLTGTLTLSFFIHNAVVALVRNNRNPKNNKRDVGIAFFMVALTYGLVGFLFLLTFPLAKTCISTVKSQLLFDNISLNDLMVFMAKIFQILQLITVYPTVNFVLRSQLFLGIFKDPFCSYKHVIVFNVITILTCVLISIFYPKVNDVIRYVGSVSGLAYVFFFPCFIYLLHCYKNNKLTWFSAVGHSFVILLGVLNLATQPFQFSNS
ncbi:hypothetical protein ACHWQZ_G015982 [Mnemiopsis leidyi]